MCLSCHRSASTDLHEVPGVAISPSSMPYCPIQYPPCKGPEEPKRCEASSFRCCDQQPESKLCRSAARNDIQAENAHVPRWWAPLLAITNLEAYFLMHSLYYRH